MASRVSKQTAIFDRSHAGRARFVQSSSLPCFDRRILHQEVPVNVGTLEKEDRTEVGLRSTLVEIMLCRVEQSLIDGSLKPQLRSSRLPIWPPTRRFERQFRGTAREVPPFPRSSSPLYVLSRTVSFMDDESQSSGLTLGLGRGDRFSRQDDHQPGALPPRSSSSGAKPAGLWFPPPPAQFSIAAP